MILVMIKKIKSKIRMVLSLINSNLVFSKTQSITGKIISNSHLRINQYTLI
jgi:hypothetical protein